MDYILHNIKEQWGDNFKLSEVYYVASGKNIAQENYDKRNAIGILYLYIYWQQPAANCVLTVENKVPLISIYNSATTLYAPIPMIRKATFMKVISSAALNFTIAHQYIHY